MVHFVQRDFITKIITAASELLENAVKHANSDGIRVKIKKHPNNQLIDLVVYNLSSCEDYEILKEIIEKANLATNTLEYYVNEMRESYERNDGKARLGIPRIRHESGVLLSLSFTEVKDDNGILSVSTEFKIA